jgi:hypothetical protein
VSILAHHLNNKFSRWRRENALNIEGAMMRHAREAKRSRETEQRLPLSHEKPTLPSIETKIDESPSL